MYAGELEHGTRDIGWDDETPHVRDTLEPTKTAIGRICGAEHRGELRAWETRSIRIPEEFPSASDAVDRFKQLTSGIEQVESLHVSEREDVIEFWTVAREDDFGAHSGIYDAEYTMFEEFPGREFQFHVIDEASLGRVPSQATKVYQRR